ncbi:NAD(+) diphosphatase [Bifidobacterium xylocopae]|uniref:NAD(+) diphosphatase n=1 Tax=Bifidobacterium xylocopae TaxID=2493119 RepID=A0A366KDR4_9BIFI|nr:NAD(+) diphosphatase [Bifidobacterium xylocopae]
MYFSPLSLTRALPFLPLARGGADYRTELRTDPGLFRRLGEDDEPGDVHVMLVHDGRLALPLHSQERARLGTAGLRPASLPGEYLPGGLTPSQDRPGALYFLGSASDEHWFALDVGLARRLADEGQGSQEGSTLLDKTADRFDWVGLDLFATKASARDVGMATCALALSAWHGRQRHCPRCGAATAPGQNGWTQECVREPRHGPFFPRIEPAVITAIVDSRDRLLLERNAAWEPTRYAVCAGFVEAGENLEHAVRREAREELGLPLGEVRYMGSQPWPFPASLMMAFKARALDTDIHVDGVETADARWMTREEYTRALDEGRMTPPGRISVARCLIEEWLGHGI